MIYGGSYFCLIVCLLISFSLLIVYILFILFINEESINNIKADEIKEARTQSEKGRRISSREDRAEFLTMIYEDSALPIRARLKAVELLCKMYGDFLERVVIKDEPVRLPVINFVYTDDDE